MRSPFRNTNNYAVLYQKLAISLVFYVSFTNPIEQVKIYSFSVIAESPQFGQSVGFVWLI
jgi:hypothetical protein